MPLEGVPQPVKTYAILLRNSQPEKVHGKPGQALPLPPSRKKIPPVLGKVRGNVMIRHYVFDIRQKTGMAHLARFLHVFSGTIGNINILSCPARSSAFQYNI